MSFQLASDLKTRQTVWIRDGKTYNPIKVCATYRETFAYEVKRVTV